MNVLALVVIIVSALIIGFGIGRLVTKIECGRMLHYMMLTGLIVPDEDFDDEEDIK